LLYFGPNGVLFVVLSMNMALLRNI